VTEANITVPVLRRIRVRSTVQGGGEAPDFRLQFFKLEGNGVRIPLIVQPLSRPANAVAAAKAWAPYGGPFVELPASADGSWEIILPEGLYTIEAVFPLPGSLSWPFGEVPSPRTTYIPTITAAGADITSQSLRIAGDTEIVVSLAPTIIR
jgi:hypothetical protein